MTDLKPGDRVHLKDATAFYADQSTTRLTTLDGEPVVYEVDSIGDDRGPEQFDDPAHSGPLATLLDVSGSSGYLYGVLVSRLVPISQ